MFIRNICIHNAAVMYVCPDLRENLITFLPIVCIKKIYVANNVFLNYRTTCGPNGLCLRFRLLPEVKMAKVAKHLQLQIPSQHTAPLIVLMVTMKH